MMIRDFKTTLLVFIYLLSFAANGFALEDKDERQIKVAMRTIGHEFLLHLGDSTSRVLPIKKKRIDIGYNLKLILNSNLKN